MSCRSFHRSARVGPRAAVATLLIAVLAWAAAPARAAINDTDWSLKISEREMAFRPATDMMAMKSLMWDIPSSRQIARSLPFISLTNESATAAITEFRMTIGDDQFHFGNSLMNMFAKIGKESPTVIPLSSSAPDDGNTLVVNFQNGGLLPGKTIHFQIDLDVDAAFKNVFFPYPDYRTVLFDMNGDNYYENAGIVHDVDTSDNSKVTLKFEMSGMPSVSIGPVPFADESVSDGSAGYVNSNLARYGQSDPIRSFTLSGGSVVPEPSSLALIFASLLGSTLPLRRKRRSSVGAQQLA